MKLIGRQIRKSFHCCFLLLAMLSWVPLSGAHHVLGRPAYSLNEDSNTPPSMQVETQIGSYYATYMVFPAFPKANAPGRVNVYVSRIDNGRPFIGEMTFIVINNSWFNKSEETLGIQIIDDGVYRQGFLFKEDGDFIIRAEFESDDEPYQIDFPLRIGDVSPIGPIGMTVATLAILLIGVNVLQRKRLARSKIQSAHTRTNRP